MTVEVEAATLELAFVQVERDGHVDRFLDQFRRPDSWGGFDGDEPNVRVTFVGVALDIPASWNEDDRRTRWTFELSVG